MRAETTKPIWSSIAAALVLVSLWMAAWRLTEDCMASLFLSGAIGVALIAQLSHHSGDGRRK